jgi:hypothetical protein
LRFVKQRLRFDNDEPSPRTRWSLSVGLLLGLGCLLGFFGLLGLGGLGSFIGLLL